MNTKTKQILDQQWIETKAAPAAPLPRSVALARPASRPLRAPVREWEVETLPAVNPQRVGTLVNRQLVFLLNNHLSRMAVKEVYGRIALVKFEPKQSYDPIMPVPLLPLEGQKKHNKAFGQLARLLIVMETPMAMTLWDWFTGVAGSGIWAEVNSPAWLRRARKVASVLIESSQDFLTEREWAYYSDQIQECVANPLRVEYRNG